MKVDEHISAAIARYLDDNCVQAKDFRLEFGVSEPAFSNWRRVGRGILEKHWQKLFPFIKKYLPASRIYIDAAGNEKYSSAIENESGERIVFLNFVTQMVPRFNTVQLSGFNAALHSIEQLAEEVKAEKVEYRPRSVGCGQGIFAFVASENKVIPEKALVFASSDLKPKDGGVVIFVDAESNVDIGTFRISGNAFMIQAKKTISGDPAKILEFVRWIFPVVYYEVITY